MNRQKKKKTPTKFGVLIFCSMLSLSPLTTDAVSSSHHAHHHEWEDGTLRSSATALAKTEDEACTDDVLEARMHENGNGTALVEVARMGMDPVAATATALTALMYVADFSNMMLVRERLKAEKLHLESTEAVVDKMQGLKSKGCVRMRGLEMQGFMNHVMLNVYVATLQGGRGMDEGAASSLQGVTHIFDICANSSSGKDY